ncbi:C4-dicarboxylic acid transporter DauA [Microbulbifer rhizosphaerae]|uniref:SulP family sulfate permease n=1 Tax=Microbulbifer rhizosphaerae TaxID=1562603 RepID=A0A7W4WEY6_9GAMM|nr:C4-dicarboxylic acid transporter DauA [Microbulbifer rhizosphaerae]MBB3062971.1 SulP family sulfate permease [Microbulbifer rhizosphaerae]
MFVSALRQSFADGSLFGTLPRNLIAGITVGIVALPLSMGLAIASGVPPQHGLYTAIVGGIVVALLGGSRVNISGPTAAFVVVLLPVVQQFGLGGLLLAGLLAGLITIGFGLLKLGRLIQIIPYPVIVGFTSGIGTVIAFLQMKDFLGLQPEPGATHFLQQLGALAAALPSFRWQEFAIGALTLGMLILWKKVPGRIPAYLVALLVGTLVASVFNGSADLPDVDTIASRFRFSLGGVEGSGIPPVAPHFLLPWQLPGPDGMPIGFSWELLRALIGPAFSIALLGALESLLCAVVADGMSGQQHDPDGELVGQGMGNIAVAFFGGIPVTAAIARTATNVRSGGSTPLSAVVHGLFVLLAMLLLAPWLSLIPMAAMAAVLLVVAWNMSEAGHALHILRRAPRADAAVLLTCFALTVAIDMQVAVAAGLALASVLFIRRVTELTQTTLIKPHGEAEHQQEKGVVLYDLDGPLFFGAAYKALKIVTAVDRDVHTVVLDMRDVAVLDATAMENLEAIARHLAGRHTTLYLIHVRPALVKKMRRYGLLDATTPTRLARDYQAVLSQLSSA